jgi:hypothetical protein
MEQKKFDDWQDVNCNECSNWWNDSCTGAPAGVKKPCNSFLAQRSVIIPEEIKALKSEIKWLSWHIITLYIVVCIHIVLDILGG